MFTRSKKAESDLLDNLYIAAPCSVSWESMTGDDRARACSMCSRNVYNLSDMTKKEAVEFLEENGVSQCLTFYRREDGTIMTDDCPVALRKLRDQCKLAMRMVAVTVAFLLSPLGCFAQKLNTADAAKKVQFYGGGGHAPKLSIIDEQPLLKEPKAPMMTGGLPIPIPNVPMKEAVINNRPRGIIAPIQNLQKVEKFQGDAKVIDGTEGTDKGGADGAKAGDGKDPYIKLKATYNEMADPTAFNLFVAGRKNLDEGKILVARAYFKASLKAFDPANCDWKLKQLVEEHLKKAENTTPAVSESEEDDAIMNIEFDGNKPRLIYTK